MGQSIIENEDKLIDKSDDKKLLSALNRLNKAFKEINDMGYHSYVTPSSINIMADKSQDQNDVVASVFIQGVDMGDW